MTPDRFAKAEAALAALKAGRISEEEYEAYLRQLFGPTQRREQVHRAAAMIVLLAFVAIAGWSFLAPGTITGLVTYEETATNFTFSETGTRDLNATDITSFRISGETTASADIYLVTDTGRHLVASFEQPAFTLTTDKISYASGSPIITTVTPPAPHTLWLTHPTGEKEPFVNGSTLNSSGTYTLDALINGSEKASTNFSVRNDTNSSRDVVREPDRWGAFSDACLDTCTLLPTGNGPHELETVLFSEGVVRIDSYTTSARRENDPPVQTEPLPPINLTAGEYRTINLSNHFSDPDNDTITYDYMNIPGVDLAVDGEILRISGGPGSGSTYIYASDLEELVQSDAFTITITAQMNTNETNETLPEQSNETSESPMNDTASPPSNGADNPTETVLENETVAVPGTVNGTASPSVNGTVAPSNGTAPDCSHPDPNLRDPSCFVGEEEQYFRASDDFLIENRARAAVARFNTIGNLLITGEVREFSSERPEARDFSVGYLNEDFEFVATAWIDSRTGDLHLRGALTEEAITLQVPPNSHSFQNRRGINLGYVNPRTGDMWIRGNVIPYRRSI